MREITNGFANRFLMLWPERAGIVPFPKETRQLALNELATRTYEIHRFVKANRSTRNDQFRMEMSVHAMCHYAQL